MENLAVINQEKNQKDWAALALQQSKTLVVDTQQDYDNAADVCKDIKARIKQVEQYWKPLKEAAAKQHKDICAKEKELLKPFADAETDIKRKMTEFQRRKMEEERLLREEQERFRKKEEERLLKLAVEAEEEGKDEHSEYLVEQAQVIHTAEFKQPEKVKTAGTAVKTIWKACIINEKLVPVELNGMLLRPVDTALINKLAVSSKGQMQIPGVEFYEDINIAISRG